jgi:hypothetical protein
MSGVVVCPNCDSAWTGGCSREGYAKCFKCGYEWKRAK